MVAFATPRPASESHRYSASMPRSGKARQKTLRYESKGIPRKANLWRPPAMYSSKMEFSAVSNPAGCITRLSTAGTVPPSAIMEAYLYAWVVSPCILGGGGRMPVENQYRIRRAERIAAIRRMD